ncbi:MAG: hypothetical protein V4479_12415, partial [Actinomycetota bacterium]
MRRILSAAAALVLAFGTVLLGATAAGADGTIFSASGMPGYVFPGETITMSGNLPAGYTLTGLSVTDSPGSSDPGTFLTTSGSTCYADTSSAPRDWSCTATLPSDLVVGSSHDLLSNYNNGEAGTINSTFNVDAIPSPTLT